MSNDDDICGICGKPGADKIPHPCHWPGEQLPETKYVHADCEKDECKRAFECLSSEDVTACLGQIRNGISNPRLWEK